MPVRQYIAGFGLRGAAQAKKVGVLSGGERNRVHLAKVLKRGHNLLLLDEPTNDLDVHTLRALEDALQAYAGAAVVISHDRWFLDRICTHTLAFLDPETDGEAGVEFYPGSYSEYREDREDRLGTAKKSGNTNTKKGAAEGGSAGGGDGGGKKKNKKKKGKGKK